MNNPFCSLFIDNLVIKLFIFYYRNSKGHILMKAKKLTLEMKRANEQKKAEPCDGDKAISAAEVRELRARQRHRTQQRVGKISARFDAIQRVALNNRMATPAQQRDLVSLSV